MTDLLDPNVIAQRVAALGQPDTSAYQWVRPLTDAAETYISVLENPGQNFMLGLGEIDVLTRGFRAEELVMVTGFSHGGKTQLVLNMLAKNTKRRVLYFSLDDPAEMVLSKLIAVHDGIPSDELELKLQAHDEFYREHVLSAASRTFSNLVIVDEPLRIDQMDQAIEEATDLWKAAPECVIIDYLALVPTEGGYDAGDGYARTAANARSLKRWVKGKPFPLVAVHQATRGAGGPGKPVTLVSSSYGGEQEATILLGVRRKLFDETLVDWERRHHESTITVHVVKNKRPPNRRTSPEGIDFHLEETTGAIRRLREADWADTRDPLPEDLGMFDSLDAEIV